MKVAMLGSRDLSLCHPEAKALFRQAASQLARQGCTIVALPSRGGCQLAAASALVVGGTVELLIPYQSYEFGWAERMKAENGDRVKRYVFDVALHREWVEADHILHPAHKMLGGADEPFFACVYGTVQMSNAVIALPHNEEQGVEVAPAIRVARALGKPLLVLSDIKDREQLEAMLNV